MTTKSKSGPRRGLTWLAVAATVTLGATTFSLAQSDAEKEIERYRAMINDPDGQPGLSRGRPGRSRSGRTARGTKNVSLETCDLGEGAGKLEGAYAKLPRYFKDADKVMDLEQRLLWCMETSRVSTPRPIIARAFPGPAASDMEDLVAFIANKSNGMKIDPQMSHPKEKELTASAKPCSTAAPASWISPAPPATRNRASASACRACLIFSRAGQGQAQETMGSWPTYRVSQSALRTMQHRLWDCFRQQRWPQPDYAADGSRPASMFLNVQAAGGEITFPPSSADGRRHDERTIIACASGLSDGSRVRAVNADVEKVDARHVGFTKVTPEWNGPAIELDEPQKMCTTTAQQFEPS
jgi:L-cysteine S-thiosulfotransferase